ncbi:hypothetical protein [uncultured Lacinutrix sp.]|uniref:hypothetical protein n=1 Tax=uncultured Lacinutrix sp. TaxID=574032 RepID=UPI002615E970|nr:hypothetical protein [uncultured Lacinutrix sp.]
MKTLLFYCFLYQLIMLSCWQIQAQEKTEKTEDFKFSDLPIEWQGFIDSRHGPRLQSDPYQSNSFSLSETRLQLQLDHWTDASEIKLKTDFIYDSQQGKFLINLREANLFLTPSKWFDVKIGRQILTWGKGDMLFVNDLFPKDWQSFFIGRELEYLKSYSDAVKLTVYLPWFEFNTVYVPAFNSDVFPTGKRLSFFNPFQNAFVGNSNPINITKQNTWFKNNEIHWRARKNVKGFDLALYGYYGYWKSPAGLDLQNGNLTFPKLSVHGLSFEGNLFKGITSFEAGYYHSIDDANGEDFSVRNSQWIFLLGYTRDLKNDLSFGIQYYAEMVVKYNNMINTLPTGAAKPNRLRDMITLRLTKLLVKQKLKLSLFSYYSISDNDAYLRPNVSYKLTDAWKIEAGGNLFMGENDTTFWNQFQNNNNIYVGLKRSF